MKYMSVSPSSAQNENDEEFIKNLLCTILSINYKQ